MMVPNISASISGAPKSGKTHLALSFPEPIVVFSFDLRGAELLVHKPEFADKAIDIKTYLPPITTTKVPDAGVVKLWNKIEQEYRQVTEEGLYKTIIVDPATMLWEIIRHSWAVEEGREVVGKPRNYGEPNARMTWILTSPIVVGMNVVTTQYLKEVYANDQPTGEKTLDGFKRTEGLVDVALLTQRVARPATPEERKDLGMKEVNVIKTTITDCRFDLKLNGMELENTNYEELIAMLGVEV